MAVQEKGARSTGRKTECEKSGWKRTTFGLDMPALLYRLTCVELEQWNPLGGSISHHTPFVLAQNEKNNHCSWVSADQSFHATRKPFTKLLAYIAAISVTTCVRSR